MQSLGKILTAILVIMVAMLATFFVIDAYFTHQIEQSREANAEARREAIKERAARIATTPTPPKATVRIDPATQNRAWAEDGGFNPTAARRLSDEDRAIFEDSYTPPEDCVNPNGFERYVECAEHKSSAKKA